MLLEIYTLIKSLTLSNRLAFSAWKEDSVILSKVRLAVSGLVCIKWSMSWLETGMEVACLNASQKMGDVIIASISAKWEESEVYIKKSCRWCLWGLVIWLMWFSIYKFYLRLKRTAVNLVERASNVVHPPALPIFMSKSKISWAALYVALIIMLADISKYMGKERANEMARYPGT